MAIDIPHEDGEDKKIYSIDQEGNRTEVSLSSDLLFELSRYEWVEAFRNYISSVLEKPVDTDEYDGYRTTSIQVKDPSVKFEVDGSHGVLRFFYKIDNQEIKTLVDDFIKKIKN